jgi:outer membrane protein
MTSRRFCGVLALALACFAFFSSAFAQFNTPDQEPAAWNINQKPAVWDVNLAAGAAMEPTFNGSDRYRVIPIPLVIIRWRDVVSLGQDGLNLYWHNDDLRIGGGITYDGGRSDHATNGILSSGDNRLMGLGNVDGSVGFRAFTSYKFGPAFLDSSVIKYIGPQNKGVQVNVGASAPWALTKQFIVRPHIGMTWADDNYMRTFFGVSPIQASRSIFPQFNTGAGVEDLNGGLTIVYLLTSHWVVGADASAKQYLDNAARSPITISNTNTTVAAVVGYHF